MNPASMLFEIRRVIINPLPHCNKIAMKRSGCAYQCFWEFVSLKSGVKFATANLSFGRPPRSKGRRGDRRPLCPVRVHSRLLDSYNDFSSSVALFEITDHVWNFAQGFIGSVYDRFQFSRLHHIGKEREV